MRHVFRCPRCIPPNCCFVVSPLCIAYPRKGTMGYIPWPSSVIHLRPLTSHGQCEHTHTREKPASNNASHTRSRFKTTDPCQFVSRHTHTHAWPPKTTIPLKTFAHSCTARTPVGTPPLWAGAACPGGTHRQPQLHQLAMDKGLHPGPSDGCGKARRSGSCRSRTTPAVAVVGPICMHIPKGQTALLSYTCTYTRVATKVRFAD